MSVSAYVIHPDRFISATPRPTVPPVAETTAPLAYYTMFDAHTRGCRGGEAEEGRGASLESCWFKRNTEALVPFDSLL